jgi:hypothetical protein
MTIDISNNDPRISYSVAQGVTQTSFVVPFEFFDDSDVNVYVDGTLKTITTDYTITGGGGSTGTVNISVTGGTGGSVVVLTRSITIERTTDFTAGADINRAALNTQLDTLTGIAADVKDATTLALRYNDRTVGVTTELPDVSQLKGRYLAFNSSTGAPEAGATTQDVNTLANVTADIARLADIEDGTLATNAIQTVSGISGNVSTVAGISGNVTTVAGISSSVTAVAADATDIGTVATDIADVSTVAGSISSVNTNAANITAIQNASSNATAAAASAAAAASSEADAATSETNAASSASSASTSASNASTSATNAASSATSASNSASAASSSETNAASSASAAATSATNASSSASAASTSATNAATNATNAATSATNAATSETNAATSASNAASSATSAASAQTAAETARDQTLAAYDNFDDRYLGAKASDPTLDNDGNALVGGALYFDTTNEVMKVYTGSTWVAAYASLSGALLVANNLSDLSSASSARTNLGLGTAATTASTDYATAAQGALADSALQSADIGVSIQAYSSVLAGTTASYTTAEETKLAGIEAGATADQTAAEIKTAYESNANTNAFTDAEQTKLAGVETGADVTDTANVTAAGALMDSEIADLSAVKAINQGLSTINGPTFAGLTLTTHLDMGNNDQIRLGDSDDLLIYHDGSNSYVQDNGSGSLLLKGTNLSLQANNGENFINCIENAQVALRYNNSTKFETTTYGAIVYGSAVATTSTTSVSGSVTLDFNANQNFVLTMTGNVTLANPSTEKVGQSGFIVLIHSGAGRTVSLGTDYETAGGAGLTLSGTSGATDIVPYIVAASGRILLGTPQLAFS